MLFPSATFHLNDISSKRWVHLKLKRLFKFYILSSAENQQFNTKLKCQRIKYLNNYIIVFFTLSKKIILHKKAIFQKTGDCDIY